MKIYSITPLILALALLVPSALQAQEAEVKAIAKAYSAAEAQLKDMSHFSWTAEDVTEEFTHNYQLWRNLDGQVVKVTDDLERITSRDLTEYFFDKNKLAFVFIRSQQNEDGAGTMVTESRCYIVDGRVVQKQTKTAKFKEGEKIDMAGTKQVKAEPGESDDPAVWEGRAIRISRALQAGPGIDEDAPSAGDQPAAAKEIPEGPASKVCRVIEGSASPDGRYALAWGVNDPAKGPQLSEEDEDQNKEGVVNYIVDTKADRVLAVTNGGHFGSKASYNHWEHHAIWSQDSTLLIQAVDMKWATLTAQAFRLDDGKATLLTNLLEDVKSAVEAKIAKAHAKAWKEQAEHCTFTISELKLGAEGKITLTAYHQIPKEDGGFTTSVTGKFGDGGKFEASRLDVTKN